MLTHATRWRRGVGFVLAAWLLSVFFVASAAADLRDLARLESRSYVIHTNLSPIEARDFGRHMDLIYREYSKRFSVLRGQGRGKQNLYLLRTRDDYVNAMAEFGIDASATGGMFFWGGGRSGLATWVEGLSRDQVFSTLQHEGFHQFAHSKLGRELPLWVNEGLAEYFGSAIVVQDKVRLGIVDADRVEKLRTALRQNRALPFDELLHTTSQQWFANMNNGSDRGHLQYDQSWSIVHFLIHGDKGRYQKAFENYLVLISRGRDHDEAFAKSFGTTNTGPFAQRWLKFIDEVEPDDYSTALKRIQFLGAALEFLRGQPGVEMPGDLETLRTMLQERQFRLTRMTEAGASVIEASDDALYGYTDAGGKPQPFVVVRGEEVDLPPRLTAEHLDPAVTLIWARDAEGHLRSQLVYE